MKKYHGLRSLLDFVAFVDFHIDYLVFDVVNFMPAIVVCYTYIFLLFKKKICKFEARHRLERPGDWRVLISAELSFSALNSGLAQGMTFRRSAGVSFTVKSSGKETFTIQHLEEFNRPGSQDKVFEMGVKFHE